MWSISKPILYVPEYTKEGGGKFRERKDSHIGSSGAGEGKCGSVF